MQRRIKERIAPMREVNLNYINGQWIAAKSGEVYEQRSPADLDQATGVWQKSSEDDVREAIVSAAKAYGIWKKINVYKRAEYFKKALSLMKNKVEPIAEIITAENGKTLEESRAEITSAIKEMDFQVAQALRYCGQMMPSAQEHVMSYCSRVPLGVAGIISPWNFPFNVAARKITPALMAGNSCVLKPATLTPGSSAEFVKLFEEAGLPAGVLNFVTGSGAVIGNAIVTNSTVKAISFTGSTDIGMEIYKRAALTLTRTQIEMGGNNPLLVLKDADLEKASDSAVSAGYACAGQWCTSTSRVIIEERVYDVFMDMLLEKVKKIVVGHGTDPQVTMGPVCGKSQLEQILACIETGKKEGASLVSGGNRIIQDEYSRGCFIEPTVFTDVKPDMFIAQEEIFGPVLSVIKVTDFEHAVRVANDIKFGLSSSVYTKDLNKAFTFIEKTDVGLTHVNISTAVKEPQFSFGGVKLSGTGIPEAGDTGIDFFTKHKTVYIKYV